MTSQKVLTFLGLFLSLAILIGYNNCGKSPAGSFQALSGTDTGNAGDPAPPLPELESLVCRKLATCFTPSLLQCESKLLEAPHISLALGLNETLYPHLRSIHEAVANGHLSRQPAPLQKCLEQISLLTCTDPLTQSSYNTSRIEDLSQAFRLLSVTPECGVFLKPPTL